MESDYNQPQVGEIVQPVQKNALSKYVVLLLAIFLSFAGLCVGYYFAPEKIVEKQVSVESSEPVILQEDSAESSDEAHEILKQYMGYWRAVLMSDQRLVFREPEPTGGAEKFAFTVPIGWIARVDQSGSDRLDVGLQFTDPKYPGREDSDVPRALIEFRVENDAQSCTDTFTLQDEANRKVNNALSRSGLTVYDSGWGTGWANLPSRVMCYELEDDIANPLLLFLYPISEENQEILNDIVANATINL